MTLDTRKGVGWCTPNWHLSWGCSLWINGTRTLLNHKFKCRYWVSHGHTRAGPTQNASVQRIPPTQSAQKCPKVRFAPNTPNCPPNWCPVFPLCEQGGTYTSAQARLVCCLLPVLSPEPSRHTRLVAVHSTPSATQVRICVSGWKMRGLQPMWEMSCSQALLWTGKEIITLQGPPGLPAA